MLPAAVRRLVDWQSLLPAPEKLHGQPLRLSIADLVFRAARTTDGSPVWFVVEHKSVDRPDVERQMRRYAVHLDERVQRSHAPSTVIGVVCHHGARPFPAALAARSKADPFAPFVLRFPLLVDDLGQRTEAELRARRMTPLGTLIQSCLRSLPDRTGDECLRSFARWGDLLRAVDRDREPPRGVDAITKIGWYALTVADVPPHTLHATFERILQRPEETIMGTLEHTYQRGKAEGKAEGRADTLVCLLQKRFGPLPDAAVARVHGGSDRDLARWTDRLLDVARLDDLFAD